MAEWKHFPLLQLRPTDIRQFDYHERDLLELTIAYQVSDLLARHASVVECEVDLLDDVEIEEPKTFELLELDDLPLEDGGDLCVSQIAVVKDSFCTDPGAHVVQRVDDRGYPKLSLTVWDPELDVERRIHNERGRLVSRLVLQELTEALSVALIQLDTESPGNPVPHRTHEYPMPVIDEAFQGIIASLED